MTPDEIRTLRDNVRATQPTMAAYVGVSLRLYKAWEAGEMPVSKVWQLEKLKKLRGRNCLPLG